jgi:hypothetical protein
MVLGMMVGLVVAGALAAGVWFGWTVLRDRPALIVRAQVAEQQAAALDATLAITRTQYETERQLWATAYDEQARTIR